MLARVGAGHGHDLRQGHAARLGLALAVLAAFLAVEVTVGLLTGSLALLSDAGHMATDVLGLAMALGAALLARRPSARHTYGLYRAEVLAALANAVLLLGVAAFVLVEGVRRLTDPPVVAGLPVLVTAAAGLVANVVAFLILRDAAATSINVRGAYLEVLADTVGSIGVLVSGALTLAFGWRWVDPIVAIGIGLFIVPRTIRLARTAIGILAEGAPPHLDLDEIRAALCSLPAVREAHDVHVWTLTSGMDVASVHLATNPRADAAAVLSDAQDLLHDRFGLDHVTIQVEPALGVECRTKSHSPPHP
jgi:cobalt-zinc-cadmium efflux system protein